MKLISFIITLCLTLTACNTIKGAGKDIQKAGQKIENAATN